MSSIYKKGRDGYFYYQAYIYDKKTKKKNKKIFHSLGTKDANIAKEKQFELDQKYSKKDKPLRANYKILFSFFFSFNLILFLYLFMKPISKKEQKKEYNFIINDSVKMSNIEKESTGIDKEKVAENEIISIEKFDIIMPTYIVQRIEKSSGSFKQGSIYITVSGKPNSEQLKLLCDKIKVEYSQFTNIVICIYSQTDDGILLAKGGENNTSSSIIESNWIAMYTFNPVEGEYFSDRPAAFLGGW